MSKPEVILWSRLRGRSEDRPRFHRQHPLGAYILDFYCPAAKLAVEIDGRTHGSDDAERHDRARDAWLGRQGIEVLRVPAGEVFRDLNAVATGIICKAEAMRLRLSPSTTRSSAGGPPPPASRER